jgi:ribonuclease VapC
LVIDTSALLAILFNEPMGPWCLQHMEDNEGALVMSAVNYAEALVLIQDRQPVLAESLADLIASRSIQRIPPTSEEAEIAAKARLRFPLNLGDCFAYALAKYRDDSLLTLDRDFRRLDIPVLSPHTKKPS